jgi:hypothetical protein
VLAELMNDPKATATARAMAADRVLDRAYGKASQATTRLEVNKCNSPFDPASAVPDRARGREADGRRSR